MIATDKTSAKSHFARKSKNMIQRSDFVLESKVDLGISIQNSIGTMCAIEFMKGEGIPNLVIHRVLKKPSLRRQAN